VAAILVAAPLLTATFGASRAAASSGSAFCAAIGVFNAVRPTSRAESVTALQNLAHASPTEVRRALQAIARAVHAGDPQAVLTQASGAQASETDALDQEATTVLRDADGSCHATVNFLAALPTGLSDQRVAPRVWGRTVCNRLVDWGEYLMNAGNSLLTPAGGVTVTLPEVQTELSDFLDTSILRTQELVNDIDDAGTPSVADGHAIATYIRTGVVQAQRTFVAAQPTVRALPDDPHAFQVATQALVQTLDDTGRSVAALMHDAELLYKVRALTAALAAEPACVGVR
jgi:hypothetical protein